MAFNLTMTSATYDTSGKKYGTACLSGGSGNVLSVLTGVTQFSVQAWFKTTNTSATIQVFVGQRDAFWIGTQNGNIAARYGNATSSKEVIITPGTAVPVADGTWHHARLEVSSTGGKLYVDGVQVSTNAGTFTTTAPNTTTYPLSIGTYVATSTFPFTGSVDDVAVYSVVFDAAFTPSQVGTTEPNLKALWALDSNGTDTANTSSATTITIAPDNAGFYYAPYVWDVTSVRAKSINAGAYFKVLFTGASCTLNFDITNNSAPVSQIYAKIDNGTWNSYTLTASIALPMPSDNTWTKHLVQVVIKSTSETINRWSSPQNTAINFTGITIDTGGTLSQPQTNSLKVLYYGDSITEGVRTLSNNTGVTDVFRNDAFEGWAWKLSQLLGVEYGIVGFGFQGFSHVGNGNVPIVGSSYNLLWNGTSRNFTPSPNLVIINEGHNDATTDIVAAATTFLNNVLTACPIAKIAVLRPFSGLESANLQLAIAACNDPQRVSYIDTTGFFDTTLSADTVHPFGVANDAIAKRLLPLIKPLIATAYPGGFLGV